MKHLDLKQWLPHLAAILVFFALSAAYFNPELQGKKLQQGDVVNYKGMSKEIVDFREETGEEALWTNRMFGGMPAYQISVKHQQPVLDFLDRLFKFGFKGGLGAVFLYMFGFYVLMLALGFDPYKGALGAIAFGLSSYFFIIIEAGHTSKSWAIGYMPAVMAGFILLFQRKKYLAGLIISTLFMGLEVKSNHPQITYYLLLALFILGIFYLVDALKKGELNHILRAAGLFILASIIGVGMSSSRILSTLEYSPATTRGGSELTPLEGEKQTTGLDKDYATAWSYGVGESWTLLVPGFQGGGSGPIGSDQDALESVSRKNRQSISQGLDRYWGDQPFTSGPVYAGAIVFLLAILGLIYSDGPLKWGLLTAGILTLALSWGKNFMPLTDFFLDYFPAYNKFRAVSMILVIVELVLPLLAILGLDALIKKRESIASSPRNLYIGLGAVAGILLLMLLSPSLFTDFFKTGEEAQLMDSLQNAGFDGRRADAFLDDAVAARSSIFSSDVLRSLIFILLGSGVVVAMIRGILKERVAVILIGLLVLIDMWGVNQRYLDTDDFVNKRKVEQPFQASQADKQILNDPDPYFRVFNTTRRLDQDAQTSYFHNSLGGYHGAKLRRFQDLIDRQIYQGNQGVIDMLNTKYILRAGSNGGLTAIQNPGAKGNAWFVNEVQVVADADAEMAGLDDLDISSTAVMDDDFQSTLSKTSWDGNQGSIQLQEYAPNRLLFQSQRNSDGFAVFSDIYYQPGWQAYIDGEIAEHVRVNYVLRGMEIPSGAHAIEFRFEPAVMKTGTMLNWISSIILLLMIGFGLYRVFSAPASTE